MTGPGDHKRAVRAAFTRQAEAYAASSTIAAREPIEALVRAVGPTADDRVLEVATGPGHVAFGFAEACDAGTVVGIDLTAAPLALAETDRRDRELAHVHFGQGDAEALPFRRDTFDVVVCRLAFHHLAEPARVLAEMVRVCRSDGTVAVADLVASEHPDRAAYQNRFERLRDPSHVRALPLTELVALFTAAGLETETVTTGTLVQSVDDWLETAGTPPDRAVEARALIERDARDDRSGTRPFREDGSLSFVHRTATVVGRPVN